MAKHKNVFVEAVSEMKHFLLGAALVVVLVSAGSALAQTAPPPSGGSMPPPSGGSMPPPGGDMSGGSQMPPPTGGSTMGQPTTGGSFNQSGQTGGQMGVPGQCPTGETGTPPNCSGAMGSRSGTKGGMGNSFGQGQGQGSGLEKAPGQTGTFPSQGDDMSMPSDSGKSMRSRFNTQPSDEISPEQSGKSLRRSTQETKKPQFKKPVKKGPDVTKMVKPLEKIKTSIEKAQAKLGTKLDGIVNNESLSDARKSSKALSAVSSAAKQLRKFAITPPVPFEFDVELADCEEIVADGLDAIRESLAAKDPDSAIENIDTVYSSLLECHAGNATAIQEAAANAEANQESDFNMEEDSFDSGFGF